MIQPFSPELIFSDPEVISHKGYEFLVEFCIDPPYAPGAPFECTVVITHNGNEVSYLSMGPDIFVPIQVAGARCGFFDESHTAALEAALDKFIAAAETPHG